MTQLTVRGVEDAWVAKAKAEAAARGVSMNQLLLEALARGLNVKGERLPKSNLDRYAGDSDFGANWDRYLDQDLHRIDPELWT
jgi:plasmid stability protein